MLACKGCCMHLPTTGKQQDPWTCSCCGCVACVLECCVLVQWSDASSQPPTVRWTESQQKGKVQGLQGHGAQVMQGQLYICPLASDLHVFCMFVMLLTRGCALLLVHGAVPCFRYTGLCPASGTRGCALLLVHGAVPCFWYTGLCPASGTRGCALLLVHGAVPCFWYTGLCPASGTRGCALLLVHRAVPC